MVGLMEPAGARALDVAAEMLAGSGPTVRVKLAVVEPAVMVTGLSPESVVGVQDQLPDPSAVAETVWLPTVPETLAAAVVTPERVGVAEVTQKCFDP